MYKDDNNTIQCNIIVSQCVLWDGCLEAFIDRNSSSAVRRDTDLSKAKFVCVRPAAYAH